MKVAKTGWVFFRIVFLREKMSFSYFFGVARIDCYCGFAHDKGS